MLNDQILEKNKRDILFDKIFIWSHLHKVSDVCLNMTDNEIEKMSKYNETVYYEQKINRIKELSKFNL
jgi:hypothetical protein